jgi:hypothetical protein
MPAQVVHAGPADFVQQPILHVPPLRYVHEHSSLLHAPAHGSGFKTRATAAAAAAA